ncbi:MAG TPA: cardiolipin synthase [Thermoanaerobaculia bacterium]|nr:cardiolipin synthase [Thermoanaerobaculia bacterium]
MSRALQRLLFALPKLLLVPWVARRHRPRIALAWLAVIHGLPWIGPLLYLLLGDFGLRRSVRRHARIRKELEEGDRDLAREADGAGDIDRARESGEDPGRRDPDPDDSGLREMIRLTEGITTRRFGGLPILAGNRVELVIDTDDAVDRLVAAIDGAERHVHLLFFIINPDEVGRRVADALVRAARRGARCRVLADEYGSGRVAEPSFFDSLAPELRRAGVEVHGILPIRLVRHPLARFDVRNHRKLAVVDGALAFAGSLNLHAGGFALPGGTWRQLTAILDGPAVHQLQLLFAEDWYFTTGELLDDEDVFPPCAAVGDVWVQTVPGGPSYESDLMELLVIGALNGARERVVITTPYFVPTDAATIALRLAALRGVQVQLLVPAASDQWAADWAGRSFFGELMSAGVEIWCHRRGLLHTKAVSVDDRFSLLGSTNFDSRSFYINYELNLVLYGTRVTADVRACQEQYLAEATRIDLEAWRHRPQWRQLAEHSAKLLSPIL